MENCHELAKYAYECWRDRGVPKFLAKWSGAWLVDDEGNPVVVGLCWAGRNEVGTKIFRVSKELAKEIAEKEDDYKWILERCGTPEQKRVLRSLLGPYHRPYRRRRIESIWW